MELKQEFELKQELDLMQEWELEQDLEQEEESWSWRKRSSKKRELKLEQ